MKKIYISLMTMIFLIGTISSAQAIVFSFSDTDFLGGASWGTMTITFENDILQIRYDAAPDGIIPSGSAVTGFGFSFNDPSNISSVDNNPSLFTNDRDDLFWYSLDNLNAIPNPANGDEFDPQITKFDYNFGVTEGNPNNITPSGILPGEFDVYSLDFRVPELNDGLEDSQIVDLTGIRLQNLPDDINGGSLFLAGREGPGPSPISEPATMLLLGSGLVGFAVVGRKKFIKK